MLRRNMVPQTLITQFSSSIQGCISISISMATCLFLRNKLKEKKKKKKHLLANSELLLEGMIRCGLKSNPISIFSEKELEQASNNYHSDQFLYRDYMVGGCGCGYDLYKGVHQNRNILIKKFDYDAGKYHIKQCISEIVALSQINHMNVVKLLGCCLETEFPIQVYEFCFNRNLFDCIKTKKVEATDDECGMLPWEDRLKVATEIAYAVTYLHTAKPNATMHRDIRSRNVLLDQNGVAILFNLSSSISIPSGKTHVEAAVVGAILYVPLDCFETGRVSEKSDVFSFGMLLLEILTGKCICDIATLANVLVEQKLGVSDYVKSLIGENVLQVIEKGLCASEYVKLLIREDRLREIVEPIIWNESVDGMLMNQKQQQQEFAKLAVRCTEKLEELRPTMMEVTKELRQIKNTVESESLCVKEEQEKV